VVDAILERNPEVSFKSSIDMDRVSHLYITRYVVDGLLVIKGLKFLFTDLINNYFSF